MIGEDRTFRELIARLREGGRTPLSVEGLWGSAAPITAAMVGDTLRRPVLYITAHLEQADNARDDMELLGHAVFLLPAFESLPGEGGASHEIAAERWRLCTMLQNTPTVSSVRRSDKKTSSSHKQVHAGVSVPIVVAPVQSLLQPVPTPHTLEEGTLTLNVGQETTREHVVGWLVDHHFTRLEWVESPGDYAVRGDIVDVYTHEQPLPVRIEFLEDRIESIRLFDLSTQRSKEPLDQIRMIAPQSSMGFPADSATHFLDYVPADTIVFWHEPLACQEFGQTFRNRMKDPDALFTIEATLTRSATRQVIHTTALPQGDDDASTLTFDVHSLQRFEGSPHEVLESLSEESRNKRVTVYCDNPAELNRFRQYLSETVGIVSGAITLEVGYLHHGFEWTAAQCIFIGHDELFHRHRPHRKIRKTYATRPLETWLDLKEGDYVVHVVHGIAKFLRLSPIQKGESGKYEEFLTLEFADHATLHVPVSQIDLVQKYIGAGHVKPPLSRLGGRKWSRTKERVEEAVNDFASELLRIQGSRASIPGTAYPQDTLWQREFEESFAYTETEDQIKVLDEIKRDLTRTQPMDRLLCGDVGYGKTELAIRAAFKVVEFGRQVAVLAPTTVLAEQHAQTFRERLSDYPFEVGCLSRFRSTREQKQLIEAAKKGRVDILIGTHRLLSKDVSFADLGLLVIDEEQRFGVEHKERLKRFRETIDVLTLTATPIPRTLHMSLIGIRDISSLTTPPLDRRSILTQVRSADPDLIRSAIIRELNRDGQVFFVHNRVRSIDRVADEVRRYVPEARVMVGHGQMNADELEKVMVSFIRHEADVLVSTNIIESGIDIPSANTIFIDQADLFGLADLHQLRGRVGRYRHRAYCYLLLPQHRKISPVATKRLKAIEEYSELGSGFRIAMRDLEIRGAGNVLGPQQSGHIAAVGYEMYCQLLEKTIRRMRGEAEIPHKPVHLELEVKSHIPKSYIRSNIARMEIYRRLVSCRSNSELEQIESDLKDAFGPAPSEVDNLIRLTELRVLCQPFTIRSIIVKHPDVIFTLDELARAQTVFDQKRRLAGSVRMPDPQTIHWRPPAEYLHPPTLLPILKKLLTPE